MYWILPSSPLSQSSLMKRYSRLYTTVSAIMYLSPVSRTRPTISFASSTLVAIGTVHMTCLPAFSAAIV